MIARGLHLVSVNDESRILISTAKLDGQPTARISDRQDKRGPLHARRDEGARRSRDGIQDIEDRFDLPAFFGPLMT